MGVRGAFAAPSEQPTKDSCRTRGHDVTQASGCMQLHTVVYYMLAPWEATSPHINRRCHLRYAELQISIRQQFSADHTP